ncbi:MAG: Crp/Fnr family transcriptional regulator [Dehalococcoidia bacterium]|nr:putative transcriptional regulator [Dehalococcoidia bacterium]MBF8304634.1 putative transcriptional regulator [Dehalococcoidia bacterium]MDO8637195.1 Crp/Fnr family transcriptional regulator [Dehalococcoidia bacterium]
MISRTRLDSPSPTCGGKPRIVMSLLYEMDLFKGLEPTELALFFDEMELKYYPAGSIVFSPEDSYCERLYILKEGRVDRYRLTASGKRLVTRQIQPGSVFGVTGLLKRTMEGNFAEATEDSIIYVVTQQYVMALLKRQPDLTLRILEIVGNRLRLLEERLVEAVYSPVSVRLAHFLLTNADSDSGVLTNLTHEEIGNTIGAVRQTVTETLSFMRKQGLVLTKPKQIRIINRHGLEELMQG